MQAHPDRFGPDALALVGDPATELLLSAASAWEIAVKHAIGKLELPEPPGSWVPSRMTASAVAPLVVTISHALGVATLPLHHRDPFDRLLVAQAQLENLPVLTADPTFDLYEVEVIRAG